MAFILYPQISTAFMSNPGLNGLIVWSACSGSCCCSARSSAFSRSLLGQFLPDRRSRRSTRRAPVLLAPMAHASRNKAGETLTPTTTRSILDSIGTRLDESREISRYLIGLLVFLGLLGTFWGLLQTIGSVGATIQSLDVGRAMPTIFEDLKAGLEAPLEGMGTAFSSSLFGLTGSLVLGFLDLQAGQAQNRFYTELEDWLSTVTDIDSGRARIRRTDGRQDMKIQALETLPTCRKPSGGQRANAAAMANLAEGIQGLVQAHALRTADDARLGGIPGEQQKRSRLLETVAALDRAKDRAANGSN
jgi:hypothetical protein